MKEPIRYPNEKILTLLVPAVNVTASVTHNNPENTPFLSKSSQDLNQKRENNEFKTKILNFKNKKTFTLCMSCDPNKD